VTSAQATQRRSDFTLRRTSSRAACSTSFSRINLSGKAVFRLHIAEANSDRLVFDVANVTLMRYLLLPLFHPGEMQSVYYLDRESDDIWRYYSMARTGKNASSLTTGHEASLDQPQRGILPPCGRNPHRTRNRPRRASVSSRRLCPWRGREEWWTRGYNMRVRLKDIAADLDLSWSRFSKVGARSSGHQARKRASAF